MPSIHADSDGSVKYLIIGGFFFFFFFFFNVQKKGTKKDMAASGSRSIQTYT